MMKPSFHLDRVDPLTPAGAESAGDPSSGEGAGPEPQDRRLRQALESARMGVWEWEIATGKVQWSAGLEAIHGREPGSFAGTLEAALADVHPDDMARMRASIESALGGGAVHHVEYRIVTPRGDLRWLEAHGAVERAEDGAALRMVGVCMDVTARKRVEHAVSESERRLRELVGSLPAAVYTCDAQGYVTLFNEAAARLWGRHPVVGKDMWCGSLRIYRPDTGEPLPLEECPMAVALREGRAVRGVEIIVERQDGTRRHVLPHPTPMYGEFGRLSGALNMLVDITESRQTEAALRETDQRLRMLLSLLPVGVYACDAEGRITFFNHRAAELWGREPLLNSDEHRFCACYRVHGTDERVVPPEETPTALTLRDGRSFREVEKIVERPDGTTFVASATIEPLLDAEGRITGAINVFHDISARKAAEEARRESEERYSRLVGLLPVAIYTCDAPSGVITFYNEHAATLWGRAPRLGDTDQRFCGSYGLYWPDGTKLPHDQTPMAMALREGREFRNQEVVIERPDGTWISVLVNIDPVRDTAGRVVGAVNVFHDISARKAAEAALRESEERLRAIAENAPAAIFIKDLAGRYTLLNPIARDALGGACDAVGKTDHELLPADAADILRRHDEIVFRTGEPLEVEETVPVDGVPVHFLSVKFPLRAADGSVSGVCGVAIDVTARRDAEEAIRLGEERYRSLTQVITSIVWTTNPKGEFTVPQPAWSAYTGQSFEQHRDFGWAAALHPDDRERVSRDWDTALQTKSIYRSEGRLWHAPSAAYRHFEVRGVPIRGADGAVREWVGTCIDVEDQKRIESALRESEAKFRNLADAISQFAWIADETGGIIWYNRRWFDYTGATPEEMAGWGWTAVHHPDHVDRVVESFSRSVRTGEPWEDIFPLRRHDGEFRWFLSRAMPIRDDAGRITHWYGTNTDITAQRSAEETLRESEQRFRVMADQAPMLVWMSDLSGGCNFFNKSWLEFTGRPLERELGHGWTEGVHPEDLARCLDAHRAAFQRREPFEIEYRLRRHDGEHRWMVDRGQPLVGPDGAFVGCIGSCVDITEQVFARQTLERQHALLESAVRERTAELEETNARLRLAERMAALGTLSAGLGHDMGNLLVPMRVRLDSLTRSALAEEQREDVEAIRTSTEYLRRLASGLRMLALDPAQGSVAETTSLAAWWTDAEPMLKNALPRGVTIESRLAAEDCHVAISRAALTQVLFNLVQNAGDAMRGRDSGKILISATASGEVVHLRVSDNGPGMSAEVRTRCMEPFFTTKPRGISTGLGLALVYGLISEAGGSVELDSEPNAGATFTMTLPRATPESAAPSGPRRTALVDVTDPRMRAFVAAELRSLAFDIRGPGHHAAHDVDLVVLDERRRATIATNGAAILLLDEPDADLADAVALGRRPTPRRIREAIRAATRASHDG